MSKPSLVCLTSRDSLPEYSRDVHYSPVYWLRVMTCIDVDIQSNSSQEVKCDRTPNLDFDMVYYADDTIKP